MINALAKVAVQPPHQTALVGLRFKTGRDLKVCIELYRRRYPCGYMNQTVENAVIIPEKFSENLFNMLRANGITYYQFGVPPAESGSI